MHRNAIIAQYSTCSETIIKMAQLCVLCKCQAAKKTRRRLSESVLPALRAIHRVAWPDRGETSDDPSWSVDSVAKTFC